jgi:hypothetical protein
VVTDTDGDKVTLVWKCAIPNPPGKCEGDFQWTGGTGKYVGIKGDNTFWGLIPNPPNGFAVSKGTWEATCSAELAADGERLRHLLAS